VVVATRTKGFIVSQHPGIEIEIMRLPRLIDRLIMGSAIHAPDDSPIQDRRLQ